MSSAHFRRESFSSAQMFDRHITAAAEKVKVKEIKRRKGRKEGRKEGRKDGFVSALHSSTAPHCGTEILEIWVRHRFVGGEALSRETYEETLKLIVRYRVVHLV